MHEKDTEHDCRLKALFKKFQEYNIILRKEKCQLGIVQVKLFGHIYSKYGMSADPSKAEVINAWQKLKDKTDQNKIKVFQKNGAILPITHETREEKRTKILCGCHSTIATINTKEHQV